MIHYNDNLNINPTGTDDFLTFVHKNLCFIELRLRLLAAWATPVVGQVFYDFSRGIDNRPVISEWERKSVSCEQTFESDINENAAVNSTE